MRHHQDGPPRGMQIGEYLHDRRAAGSIQVAGRLIGQDQNRVVDQSVGDGDALLLSAGELARLVVCPVAQSPPGRGSSVPVSYVSRRSPRQTASEGDILQGRHAGD